MNRTTTCHTALSDLSTDEAEVCVELVIRILRVLSLVFWPHWKSPPSWFDKVRDLPSPSNVGFRLLSRSPIQRHRWCYRLQEGLSFRFPCKSNKKAKIHYSVSDSVIVSISDSGPMVNRKKGNMKYPIK